MKRFVLTGLLLLQAVSGTKFLFVSECEAFERKLWYNVVAPPWGDCKKRDLSNEPLKPSMFKEGRCDCQNGGQCRMLPNFIDRRKEKRMNGRYVFSFCVCKKHWGGDNCEKQIRHYSERELPDDVKKARAAKQFPNKIRHLLATHCQAYQYQLQKGIKAPTWGNCKENDLSKAPIKVEEFKKGDCRDLKYCSKNGQCASVPNWFDKERALDQKTVFVFCKCDHGFGGDDCSKKMTNTYSEKRVRETEYYILNQCQAHHYPLQFFKDHRPSGCPPFDPSKPANDKRFFRRGACYNIPKCSQNGKCFMEAIREEGITQPTMVFSICKCNDGWYGTECENSFDEKQASKRNTVPPTTPPTEKETKPRDQTTAPTVKKTTPKTYMRPRSSRKRPYFASPKRRPSMSGSNNKPFSSSRRQSSSPRQGNNAQPTEAPTKKQAKPKDQSTAPTVRRGTPKTQYSNPSFDGASLRELGKEGKMQFNVQQNAVAPQSQPDYLQTSPGQPNQALSNHSFMQPPSNPVQESKKNNSVLYSILIFLFLCVCGLLVAVIVMGNQLAAILSGQTTTSSTTTTIETTTTSPYEADICSGANEVTVASSLDIKSSNYPSDYDDDTDCTKVFHASSNGLTFEFIDFYTESSYDFLTFLDMDGNVLETLDGFQTNYGPISFELSSVQVNFYSDFMVTQSGFHIQVNDGFDPAFTPPPPVPPVPIQGGLTCPDPFNPPSITSSRIVGGQDAVQGNWPWIAHLGGCGATILTKKADGTGHCCGYFSSVDIGKHSESDANYFTVPILDYQIHPQYNDYTISHDYCILIVPNLINNASPGAVYEPACLPDSYFGQGKQCNVAGWGTMNFGDFYGSDTLQDVDITLMSQDYCVANSYMEDSFLDESMFCAGTLDNDEYLDLEPGYDFLYMNNNAQSSIVNKLVSIDQNNVDLRFTSDYSISSFSGLQMTVMLGDYDNECDITVSRSLENARKPKSLKKRKTNVQ
ncbi:Oidioi.mRNA.OKI2018_I69.PAR.g9837.t1.cds [Oikopleura dioica]|uniref:Oidioi.mRNA.OKI2018_I69.PAR.g9837.t1.cds n=1 Tax=Oikopleura dioica TaxID=34765 RepID=A0ABN7RRQ5_OIKDI|nr:Oidioi.mRNA.OKI2018_I69.PAR.g9837.t1.cds [Oikopleura dioica]